MTNRKRTYTKYTAEVINQVVKQCVNFTQLARVLGKAPTGSTITHLAKVCVKFGIDTSHFTGQAHQRGKPAKNRLTFEDVLVCRPKEKGREDVHRLRRAMVEAGIKEVCGVCGMEPVWNDKPLQLQIDHIDGAYWNNEKHNVRFICPNCHTQTDTWGAKNKRDGEGNQVYLVE